MCVKPAPLRTEVAPVKSPPAGVLRTASRGAAATLLWPLIVSLPLALQHRYAAIWPAAWYAYDADSSEWPSPLGLSLGLGAVIVGQIWVLLYQFARHSGCERLGALRPIQPNESRAYEFREGVLTHLAQPEGFVLLGGYLSLTWMFRLMPDSYYSFEGGVSWWRVFACLLLQDGLQYLMHRFEHKASAAIYRASHKPHHRFTNPRLFDAFNGSLADTVLMIGIPLYSTALLVHCNVWTYMAFGSLYANWLVLIHSEFPHAWDDVFSQLKFGTAADHHVHHKLFTSNYGHLFMYWDLACGTYKHPSTVKVFRKRDDEPAKAD